MHDCSVPVGREMGGIQTYHVHYISRTVIGDFFLPAQLSWFHVVGQGKRVGGEGGREWGQGGRVRVSRRWCLYICVCVCVCVCVCACACVSGRGGGGELHATCVVHFPMGNTILFFYCSTLDVNLPLPGTSHSLLQCTYAEGTCIIHVGRQKRETTVYAN